MEIPLDYYRILGVPISASDDLLIQAYRDRCLQLPRREYSQYAIMARKQLLEEAYNILCDTHKSKEYKDSFFSANKTLDINTQITQQVITDDLNVLLLDEEENQDLIKEENALKIYKPFLEIDESLLIGVLLILQELGEYEQVLKLAIPYLEGERELKIDVKNLEKNQETWGDLILSIVLSHVELGTEQWQLGEYELAFESQEKALNILIKEKLFSDLQEEINNDLQKLKPYLIVSILSQEKINDYKRQKAIKSLQDLFDDREGIEGKGQDKTGLNLDDFLRFIQQIRVYLTAEEQQKIFELESKRPSVAASYLTVHALIARGFAQRKPALIVKAKNILISLTEYQDVYLEQAICALLLGQTEEAELALSQSKEYEVIDYIKKNSYQSPDLLPGLCSYGEKWLQSELFPQFSDLNHQSSSLKEYFAHRGVQNYLERLYVIPGNDSEDLLAAENQEFFNQNYDYQDEQLDLNSLKNNYNSTRISDNSDVLTLVDAQRETTTLEGEKDDLISFDAFLNSDLEATDSSFLKGDNIAQKSSHSGVFKKEKLSKSAGNKNLWWLILLLILGSALAIFLYNFIQNRQPKETLILNLDQPLFELNPSPETESLPTPPTDLVTEGLDDQVALKIVQDWLSIKAKATGSQYEVSELDKILKEPLLTKWRGNAQILQDQGAYREYEHTMAIAKTEVDPTNPNVASITADITEDAKYYQNGVLKTGQSYNDKLKVQYNVIKENEQWLIKEIKIVN